MVLVPLQGSPEWLRLGAAGVFAVYLVITARASSRLGDRRAGWVEWVAFPMAVGAAALSMSLGLEGLTKPDGMVEGYPYPPSYFIAAFATLAAVCDIRVILGGTLDDRSRTARRLWRMLLAVLVVGGLMVLGLSQLFPQSIRSSPWLLAPEGLVVALLVSLMIHAKVWAAVAGAHWPNLRRPPLAENPR